MYTLRLLERPLMGCFPGYQGMRLCIPGTKHTLSLLFTTSRSKSGSPQMVGNVLIKDEERERSRKSLATCGLAAHEGFLLRWLAEGCWVVIAIGDRETAESSPPSLASLPPTLFMFLAGISFEAPVSWVHMCVWGSRCPGLWFFSLEDLLFPVQPHGHQGHILGRGRKRNVTPSPLKGFCLIWGRGSHSPSHPHTLLLWGPFTPCPSEESFPSHSCNRTGGTLKATTFMGCLSSLESRPPQC